ncbi:hypothetical protein [uncultured Azohydromonas sp.]|jgi:hypothetical protein|uniref:hypothetical protein n=1 Tax=uncultured Azohydromonas sp. TaxID=487342 RepID=UPI0026399CE7|nr:hypothetical protein [uncultured Azohydromonas sp.]
MSTFNNRLTLVFGMAAALWLGGCGGGGGHGDSVGLTVAATPSMESGQSRSDGEALWASKDFETSSQAALEALPQLQSPGKETAQSLDASVPKFSLAPGEMKWNPGHYVVLDSDINETILDRALSEIRPLPVVKGIVLRAYWSQLEPEKGVYRFWRINRFMAKAAAQHKRFFLLLSIRGFSEGKVAPAYLRAPYYGGGAYKFENQRGTFGENLTLWNERARYRLILLIRELARRYNGNPNFEGVIMAETAFGKPVDPVTEEQKAGYYAGLSLVDTAARRAFQNTVVIQFVNYPVNYTPGIVENLLDKGIGLGSPDVYLDDPQHEQYIYPFNDQARGRVPIGMQVEHHSYRSTHAGGPFDPPPVRDLYVFARDRLHSNYIFWQRDLREPYLAWTKVLQMFGSADFPDSPSGGLSARCPAKYMRCVRQAS